MLFIDLSNLGSGSRTWTGCSRIISLGICFTIGEENLFDVQVDDRMERMLLGTSSEGRLLAAAALPGFFIYK